MTVPVRRQVVGFLRAEVGVSQRRACGLVGLHRSTSRYARTRGEDKELRERLRVWVTCMGSSDHGFLENGLFRAPC